MNELKNGLITKQKLDLILSTPRNVKFKDDNTITNLASENILKNNFEKKNISNFYKILMYDKNFNSLLKNKKFRFSIGLRSEEKLEILLVKRKNYPKPRKTNKSKPGRFDKNNLRTTFDFSYVNSFLKSLKPKLNFSTYFNNRIGRFSMLFFINFKFRIENFLLALYTSCFNGIIKNKQNINKKRFNNATIKMSNSFWLQIHKVLS